MQNVCIVSYVLLADFSLEAHSDYPSLDCLSWVITLHLQPLFSSAYTRSFATRTWLAWLPCWRTCCRWILGGLDSRNDDGARVHTWLVRSRSVSPPISVLCISSLPTCTSLHTWWGQTSSSSSSFSNTASILISVLDEGESSNSASTDPMTCLLFPAEISQPITTRASSSRPRPPRLNRSKQDLPYHTYLLIVCTPHHHRSHSIQFR